MVLRSISYIPGERERVCNVECLQSNLSCVKVRSKCCYSSIFYVSIVHDFLVLTALYVGSRKVTPTRNYMGDYRYVLSV